MFFIAFPLKTEYLLREHVNGDIPPGPHVLCETYRLRNIKLVRQNIIVSRFLL